MGAGRSAQRACERSNDWPQGGAVYPEARLAARSGQRSPLTRIQCWRAVLFLTWTSRFAQSYFFGQGDGQAAAGG